jgi:hypothetical protein
MERDVLRGSLAGYIAAVSAAAAAIAASVLLAFTQDLTAGASALLFSLVLGPPMLLLYSLPIALPGIWLAHKAGIKSPLYFAGLGLLVPIPFIVWIASPNPGAGWVERANAAAGWLPMTWLTIGSLASLLYWWIAERPMANLSPP